MSFLIVAGKIYHCLNCNDSFRVGYQQGPMWTQVGESGVFHFLELEKKYKSNAGKDLFNEGVYIHEEALCEKCVDRSIVLSKNISEEVLDSLEEMFQIVVKSQQTEEILLEDILACIRANDIKWALTIDQDAFDKTLNSKLFLKPHKNGENINNYLVRIKKGLIKEYLDIIRDRLVGSIFQAFPQIGESLSKAVDEMEAKFRTIYAGIKNEIPVDSDGRFCVAKDITLTENLNDLLQYELTVRTPEVRTAKISYYYQYDAYFDSYDKWLYDLKELCDSNYYKDNEKIVDAIQAALEEVLVEKLLTI